MLATWLSPRFSTGFLAVATLLPKALMVVVVWLYTADVLVYRYFRTRLYFLDVMEFRREAAAAYSMFESGVSVMMAIPRIKVLAVAVLLGTWLLAQGVLVLRRSKVSPLRMTVVGVVAVVLIVAARRPLPETWYHYGDKLLFENVFRRNETYSGGRPYSLTFTRKVLERHRQELVCDPGLQRRPDIVLVLVEGLSNYHSHFFSGLNDFTPELDAIAESHQAFTRFYANGWTTRGGLIALLTGRVPLVGADMERNPWVSPVFEEFYLRDNVVALLRGVGYTTFFLTTGDLAFTNKGEWLRFLGLDNIEGHEQPYYEQFPHSSFDAAPDSALYERTLQVLASPADTPRFLVLETVSSHQPYNNPDGTRNSEASVLRYTDRQIGWFFRRLREDGVLADGLVMIMGDHRAMTPYTKEELRRFGLSASALVPMVVAWGEDQDSAIQTEEAQQTDLLTSLARVVGPESCRRVGDGAFFWGRVAEADFIAHARGDDRDLVYVRAWGEEGLVRVDGDATRVERGNFSDPLRILDWVNYVRMTRARPGYPGG